MTAPSGTDRLERRRRQALTTGGGAPRFFTSETGGTPRWLSGLLAGLQAALLSLLVVVLPAVTAYVVTSADPTNAGVSWTTSARFGCGVWLLAHGVPLTVGGTVVTLIPLGLTCLAVITCHMSARRSGYPSTLSFTAGVGAYTVVAVVVSLAVRVSFVHVALAAGGAVVVSVVGLSTGLARRPEAPALRDLTRSLWQRASAPVRTGGAAGILAIALLMVVASVVTVWWVLAGRSTIGGLVGTLGLDSIGGTLLAVTELGFVPNLVVWALAWVAGPGFSVGAGTTFSPGEVVAGPLPALPLLGALPQPGTAGGVLAIAPVLLVVAGAVAGWWLHRRVRTVRWVDPVLAAMACALVSGVIATALVGVASGALGPGRMSDVGASPWRVGLAVLVGVLVGAIGTVLPTDPVVRRAVRGALRRRGPGRSERAATRGTHDTATDAARPNAPV